MKNLFTLIFILLFIGCIPKTVNWSESSTGVKVDSYSLGDYKVTVKFFNQLKIFKKTIKKQMTNDAKILSYYKNFLKGKTIYSYLISKDNKDIQFSLIHSQNESGEYFLAKSTDELNSSLKIMKVQMPTWIICKHMLEDGKPNEGAFLNFYGEMRVAVPYKDLKEIINKHLENMIFDKKQ